eukprot:1206087-Amphidinium_carterae.1
MGNVYDGGDLCHHYADIHTLHSVEHTTLTDQSSCLDHPRQQRCLRQAVEGMLSCHSAERTRYH